MGTSRSGKGRVKKPVGIKLSSTVIPGGPKKSFTAAIQSNKTKTRSKRENGVKKLKTSCPITMVVVPFHESIFDEKLISFVDSLLPNVDDQFTVGENHQVRTGYINKTFVKLVIPNLRTNVMSILDIAKVADVLLGVFPSAATFEDSAFDDLGYKTLTALRMQGLPPLVIGSSVDIGESKLGMKTVSRYFFSEFSEDKSKFVMPSMNTRDVSGLGKQVMQSIVSSFSGNLSANVSEQLALRRQRGYMLIDSMEEIERGLVAISGYSRGAGFSLSNPVSLTGIPFPFIVRRIELMGDEPDGMGEVFELSCEDRERLLESITPLRPAEMQEQTWPTEEEELEAEQMLREQKMKRMIVPRGVAPDSMEAAWLGEEVDDDDDKILSEMCDWGKEEEETDHAVFTAKKPELEQRTREEMDFVDEVDTPQTVSARERFQKYRGLKSLRNGNWDPYEELPVEYSQIHEFQDMQFAAKEGFGLISEAGKLTANKKCRLVLEPTELVEQGSLSRPLIASTLAVNECKVTVVHARVQRLPETMDEEISSKSPVTVQCGFRRIEVRPIYSDIPKYSSSTGTCPIQRMHRKIPNDTQASIMMSFYAPAIFGSCPVIVFEGDKKLMWGSVAGCAPNKPVVVKRITLTGYPFRVHQTRAVIRFMFFSPTDIDWFKPVELTTKKGLRGHISESLGTHGYMKCRFNGQLTSDDIVCMHLYKRVYPKWHSVAWTSR